MSGIRAWAWCRIDVLNFLVDTWMLTQIHCIYKPSEMCFMAWKIQTHVTPIFKKWKGYGKLCSLIFLPIHHLFTDISAHLQWVLPVKKLWRELRRCLVSMLADGKYTMPGVNQQLCTNLSRLANFIERKKTFKTVSNLHLIHVTQSNKLD